MTFLYLPFWFFKARILRKKHPLQTVIFISDHCNLRCKHCHVISDRPPITKSYETIREELQYSYDLGTRFVDFEGGEPMLWQENGRNINDLIRLAKKIGFFSTTVTTNAQLPFDHCEADSIWVSLDGLEHFHDEIRGEGTFARLEKNINNLTRKHVSVNMVVNSSNYTNVPELIEYVKQSPKIKSVSLNFHTPYEGTESLLLDWKLRKEVINQIITYKKRGYPIMNSVSGMKKMIDNSFKDYCWVTNFILPDGTRLPECTGKTAGMCDHCGLCMAGEMHSVMNFKLDTIWAGLKLRAQLRIR
ncbi:MAG: radical SAM protein [Bacteroidales bacterium]|jgi:MoaA/NifB/PqqE/SkfB family radical SAM enzyme|nr:radical SAM protein [Bacteroidales bacterium]